MYRPCRLPLPWPFAMRTSATFTPNSVSTAFLISGLVASRCTSKPSVRCSSLSLVDFSVMSGRRSTSYTVLMVLLRREPLLQLGEPFLRHEQHLAVQHVVDVDLADVDDLHAREVAAGEDQVVRGLVVDEQSLPGRSERGSSR